MTPQSEIASLLNLSLCQLGFETIDVDGTAIISGAYQTLLEPARKTDFTYPPLQWIL